VRIRGIQFAIVTIAAATTIEEVLFGSPSFTGPGGVASVPQPELFGVNLGIIDVGAYPSKAFGYFVLFCVALCAVLVVNVRRTATGRRMLAVRANERAAAAAGINVPNTKLLGASIGSFVAAIAGVLLGYKYVDFSNVGFEAVRGLQVVALAYLGGIATVSGAFVAGAIAPAGLVFALLGSEASESQLLISGVGLIIVAIKFPGGIASLAGPIKRQFGRLKERARQSVDDAPPADGGEVIQWDTVLD
jgi:branched-chain amino acid transport system permease protein